MLQTKYATKKYFKGDESQNILKYCTFLFNRIVSVADSQEAANSLGRDAYHFLRKNI